MKSLHIDDLTCVIIGLAYKIHFRIGAACFERVYEEILYHKLIKLGYKVERQLMLDIIFDELCVKDAYKIDLLVEDRLVVELKSVYPLPSVYFKQVRTQLSLIGLKNGLLLNFKVEKMIDGIHRVFNNKGELQL